MALKKRGEMVCHATRSSGEIGIGETTAPRAHVFALFGFGHHHTDSVGRRNRPAI